MKIGMMFPGQGSQSVGMLSELSASRTEVKQTLDEANEALEFDLADMMLNGPEEALNRTQNTQPAVWLVRLQFGAYGSLWMARHLTCWQGLPRRILRTGLLGSLPFSQAVQFVAERGKAMQAACLRRGRRRSRSWP